MKNLRELKFDLLSEQQLYRKYLDDYDKGKDKDKAKKIKDALFKSVKVFRDRQSGKEYVVKKSGDDGYSVKDGRIEVNRDAFDQGSAGPDGKAVDYKSTDSGQAPQGQEPAQPPQGQPSQEPEKEPAPTPEKEPAPAPEKKPGAKAKTRIDKVDDEQRRKGRRSRVKWTSEQEKRRKDNKLREGDKKKTKDAMELTNAKAEEQIKKTGIGAGVAVSQAGESITVVATQMIKDGKSEDEIRTEMHKIVNAPDSVLGSETGKEWADNGVNCALKIQEKIESEFGGMKNVEEIVWDSEEGNELINTTGHGTPADMFVKLKDPRPDGTILGISLKKDGHVRIHNGGYIEVTKGLSQNMRDRRVDEDVIKEVESVMSVDNYWNDINSALSDEPKEDGSDSDVIIFQQESKQVIDKMLGPPQDKELIKKVLGTGKSVYPETAEGKSYLELMKLDSTGQPKFLKTVKDSILNPKKEGRSIPGNELKVLAKIAKYLEDKTKADNKGVQKELQKESPALYNRLRSADTDHLKRMMTSMEDNPVVEEAMKDEILNGIDVLSILGLEKHDRIEQSSVIYGTPPKGSELSEESLMKMFGEDTKGLLSEDEVKEWKKLPDGPEKIKKKNELMEKMKGKLKVDYKDGAKSGIIKIVQELPDGSITEFPVFTMGVRTRGIGASPTFEMAQTDYMSNSLEHGFNIDTWPEKTRNDWFKKESKRILEELKFEPSEDDGGSEKRTELEKYQRYLNKREKLQSEETMISFGEFLTEVLTLQQRQKRRVAFRRSRMKRKISAEKGRKKLADRQKLDVRSQKKARNTVIGRLFPALKGKPRSDWSIADKKRAEKIVKDKQPIIKRFAKKMFKDVRKAEVERLAKYRKGKAEKK